MGRYNNTGLGHGTSGSPQGTIEQSKHKDKVDRLDAQNKILSEFHSTFKADEIMYDVSKFENYMLNLNHKDGGSKAKFLKETLGYKSGDCEKLHKALIEAVKGQEPIKVTKFQGAIKAEFHVRLKGNNGKYYEANVIYVIQKDGDKTYYRPITLIPRKKLTIKESSKKWKIVKLLKKVMIKSYEHDKRWGIRI